MQQCFKPFAMLYIEESPKTRLFGNLSNNFFRRPEFRKYISYEGHRFFDNVQNLIDFKNEKKKIQEFFFVFEIIASELVALNCLY